MAFSTFIEEKHDSPTLPEEFPVATVVYLTESNPLESEWTPFKSDWILKDGKRLNAIIQVKIVFFVFFSGGENARFSQSRPFWIKRIYNDIEKHSFVANES